MIARTGELENPAIALAQLFVRRFHFSNGVHENFQRTAVRRALAVVGWLRYSVRRFYCTLYTVCCTLFILCLRRTMARLYCTLFTDYCSLVTLDWRRAIARLYCILYTDHCTLLTIGCGLP